MQITKNMLIGDILAENPEKAFLLSEILSEFGIGCAGCGAANFETLEEGVLSHGYSEEELNHLIEELNKSIDSEVIKKESNFDVSTFKLELTGNAVTKIKEIMKKENKEKEILRVAVLAGGCSGFTYDLEITDKVPKTDLKFRQDDLDISVDRDSLEYLSGAKIDFVDTLNESGFKFINPNSTKECGCGKSFS